MDWIFSLTAFFTSTFGSLLTLAVVGTIIVLRDWRLNLIGLLIVQMSVATSVVLGYGASPEWMALQVAVTALSALILAISAYQVRLGHLMRLTMGLLVRLMAVLVVAFTWWMLDVQLTLPKVDPAFGQLLAWISLSALLLLGLSDRPLFTGSALLLWCIPAHAVTAILLVNPSLTVAIGIVELLVALACSYLILVDRGTATTPIATLTDVTFPAADLPAVWPAPRRTVASNGRRTLMRPKKRTSQPAPVEEQP